MSIFLYKHIIPIVLSIFLLISCDSTSESATVSKNIPSVSSTILTTSGNIALIQEDAQHKKDRELFESARKSLDFTKCQDISDIMTRSTCINSILPLRAKRDKDESLCDKLSDSMMRSSCTSPIILEKASSNGNTRLCSRLGDDMARQSCVTLVSRSIAEKLLDPSKCSTIGDEMGKRSCEQSIALKRATEKGDKGACTSLDPMMKSGCELQATIAQNAKSGNADSCKTLDSMMQQTCIFQSFVEQAVAKKDLEVCGSDKQLKTSCEFEAAKKLLTTSQDPKYCEYTGNKEKCLTGLIVRKAIGNGDRKVCEELENVSSQRSCQALYDSFEQSIR